MATNFPKTADAVSKAGDAAIDTTKAVQDVAKAQTDAVAKTMTKAIEATAPTAKQADAVVKPVVAAAKAPAKTAKRVAKTVKARAAKATPAPARNAAVKAAKPAAAAKSVIKKAAKAVVTAAAKVATPAKKEWTLMATKFETPKMFTDMNDRAKATVEKGQKFAAEFGDFNKGNIEAMVESSKIAAKGIESMGQEAADYTRKSFEGMTATLKSLASVKSPTDFFKLQSDYVRSAFDAAVAQSTKNTEAMVKLASDAAQPISSRFAVAVEKVKLAA